MKKKNIFTPFILILLTLLLVCNSAISSQQKTTDNDLQKNFPILNRVLEKLNNLDIKSPKPKTKTEADKMFVKELQNLTHDPDFRKLEQIASNNNEYGVKSLGFIAFIYSTVNYQNKAKEAYDRLIKLANKNNPYAAQILCLDDSKFVQSEHKIKYCKKTLNYSKDENTKRVAFYNLQSSYNKETPMQVDNLINICKAGASIFGKNDSDVKLCFISADIDIGILYNQKNYPKVIEASHKMVDYAYDGFTQQRLAGMYLRGEGVKPDYAEAIYWFEQALKKIDTQKPTPYFNIQKVFNLNDLGVAYELVRNYVAALECYQTAASMGYSLSQLNLAKMYFNGKGTIQNYKKAYAWASVAAAKGLDNASHQKDAEQLRDTTESIISVGDKTGNDLKEAKLLAQKYYNKYVLNKQPK